MPAPEPEAALERLALKLLAIRDHSRLELQRKLGARGHAGAAIDPVLDRLTALGALDEDRLVASYVAERVGKGFGPLRIRAELHEKGLADAAIDPHLEPLADTWPALLEAVAERRFGTAPPVDRARSAQRGRFLEGRGFPPELIRRHLRWND